MERSYVLSTSSGKRQAGSSFMPQWYGMHSQQIPLRLHGSQVQLQFLRFFSLWHSLMTNSVFNLLSYSQRRFFSWRFLWQIIVNSRLEVVSTDKPLYQKESRIKNIRFFISIRFFLSKKKQLSFLLFRWIEYISFSACRRTHIVFCKMLVYTAKKWRKKLKKKRRRLE